MFKKRSFLGLITARGGSKGLPGKNLRELRGKPLLAWTIEAAQKSQYLDRVVLSSDDSAIIAVAKQFGCEVPFVRPQDLATDQIGSLPVAMHALRECPGFDYLVLLQPTSPLRRGEDIDACIELCVNRGVSSCVSIRAAQEHPYWMYWRDANGNLEPTIRVAKKVVRRQDAPPVFALNGAVYVASVSQLNSQSAFVVDGTVGYEMPVERSIDIDSLMDFRIAEALAQLNVEPANDRSQ